ncbi:MAG: hypothetical protein CMK99_21325 [Pseudomonas sp.]|nr:hypothetical protein [Pseudomonas sp.]HBS80588.1 hypothetical protein [Pseudomonas sp.]|tara:strand:+ start:2622 stop:2966 length:345 start_codon:yes stop_codon:yes gene_type:complete
MNATHAALFALLAFSATSEPILSASSTKSAGMANGGYCCASGDNESLDQDDPDQDHIYDEDDPVQIPFTCHIGRHERRFHVNHQPAPSGCDTAVLVLGLKHADLEACSGETDHG